MGLLPELVTVNIWTYFWFPCSVPLVNVSEFMSVAWCCGYCSFIFYLISVLLKTDFFHTIYFETSYYNVSSFDISAQNYFAYLGLVIPKILELKNIFILNLILIVIWITLNFYNSSNLWTRYIFLYTCVFNIFYWCLEFSWWISFHSLLIFIPTYFVLF